MKTTNQPEIPLNDGKVIARIRGGQENEAKKRIVLYFDIPTPQGVADRAGGWGYEQGWVKRMFGRVFGDHEDITVEHMKGTTVEVTLKTDPEYGQQVATIAPTSEVLPQATRAPAKQQGKPAPKPAPKPVEIDDSW